jgi:hypothetical protein
MGYIRLTWFLRKYQTFRFSHQQLTLPPQTKRKTKSRFAFCLAGIGF